MAARTTANPARRRINLTGLITVSRAAGYRNETLRPDTARLRPCRPPPAAAEKRNRLALYVAKRPSALRPKRKKPPAIHAALELVVPADTEKAACGTIVNRRMARRGGRLGNKRQEHRRQAFTATTDHPATCSKCPGPRRADITSKKSGVARGGADFALYFTKSRAVSLWRGVD